MKNISLYSKRQKCALLILLISIVFSAKSQEKISQQHHDEAQSAFQKIMTEADSLFFKKSFDKANKRYHDAYVHAKKLDDSSGMAQALFKQLAVDKKNCNDFESLYQTLFHIKTFCEEWGDANCLSEIYFEFGEYYELRELFQTSLEHYNEALRLVDRVHNKELTHKIFRYRGILHGYMDDYQKSIKDFKRSLDFIEGEDVKTRKAKVYTSIAVSFPVEFVDSSIVYNTKAYDLLKDEKFTDLFLFVCYNLASMYNDKGRPEKGLEIMKRHINLDSMLHSKNLKSNYGRIMNLTGALLYDLQDYQEAEQYLKKALKHAPKTSFTQQIDIRKDLLKIYKKQNKTALTFMVAQDLETLESLKTKFQSTTTLANTEKKTEIEKKEEVIENLTQKNNSAKQKSKFAKKILLQLGILAFCILICIAFLFYRNKLNSHKMQERLLFFQLTSLQASMNPHFLFNTFSILQNYILKKEIKNATEYMTELSGLIRNVLNSSENSLIHFTDELKIIKGYMSLQRKRFQDSFDVEYDIDKKLEALNPQIPTMIIQPFIENIVVHAFPGHALRDEIIISAQLYNNHTIIIKIIDNGIGRKAANKLKNRNNSNQNLSIATKNTIERLEILNKINRSEYKSNIYDSRNDSKTETGTTVEIIIDLKD